MNEYDDEDDYENIVEMPPEDPNVQVDSEEAVQQVVTEESMILSYLFASESMFSKAAPILKAEYFSGVHAKAVKFVLDEYHRSHRVPNRVIISGKTGFLPELVSDQDSPNVIQLIEESTESFIRKQAGNQFLLSAVDRIGKDRSNATMGSLREEMEKLSRISMGRDLGSEFHDDFEKYMARAKENVNVTTGSAFFDIVLGGGLVRPSMSIYSAATGDGKSIFLANRAIDIIRAFPEEDLVYYTLENSVELTYQRLAAMMAEIDIKIVLDKVDDVREYVFRNGRKEGRLFIKRFPFKGTTMSDVIAHYYDLKAHKKARLRGGILDYQDLMSPTVEVPADNIHVRDEQVSQEVYNFVHKEELIWWTAAQQGKGADEEVEAKKGKVSGGVKKIFACDNLFIGKRTDDDMLNERLWAHCKKARSSGGINAAIPIHWNKRTQRMTDGDRLEFERVNPRLFGITSTNRVDSDPVAREQGVKAPEPRVVESISAQGSDIRKSILDRIRRPVSS